MEIIITKCLKNKDIEGEYYVSGMSVSNPRVTFYVPHTLSFTLLRKDNPQKQLDFNIETNPKNMGNIIKSFFKIFKEEKGSKEMSISVSTEKEECEFTLKGPRNEMETVQKLFKEAWDRYGYESRPKKKLPSCGS